MLFTFTPWTWARPCPRTPAAVASWRRVLWKSGIQPVTQAAYRAPHCFPLRRPAQQPRLGCHLAAKGRLFHYFDDDAWRLRHRRCARPGGHRRNRARSCMRAGPKTIEVRKTRTLAITLCWSLWSTIYRKNDCLLILLMFIFYCISFVRIFYLYSFLRREKCLRLVV